MPNVLTTDKLTGETKPTLADRRNALAHGDPFDGLPTGRYAVMAYHDENADQKLNLRFGMFPTEGYGLSNNPAIIGPPKFADSVFAIQSCPGGITNFTVHI